MKSDDFLTIRYSGRRFDEHCLPLSVLPDLRELEALLCDLAKESFLKNNASKTRLPRNFRKSIKIGVCAVEKGSVVLKLGLVVAPSLFFPMSEYDEARETLCSLIEQVNNDESTSQEYFDKLGKIGKSLNNGEKITFSYSSNMEQSTRQVEYTQETRRKILSRGKIVETREFVLRGVTSEYDKDKGVCTFKTYDASFPICVPQEFRSLFLESFNDYEPNNDPFRVSKKYLLEGLGEYAPDGKLEKIIEVANFEELDAFDPIARLDEFRDMKDGWLEGYGKAPSQAGLDWLSDFFQNDYPDDLPNPSLAPTEDGGIEAEWFFHDEDVDATLEIDLETHQAKWHYLILSTQESDYQELDASSASQLRGAFEKLYAWTKEEARQNER